MVPALASVGMTAVNFVNKNKKPLLIGAGVLVGVIVISRVVKAATKGLSDIHPDKDNVTISDNEAKIIANSLLDAMNRAGTDEDTLFNLIAPLSKDDLLTVYRKFGVKSYGLYGLVTSPADKFIGEHLTLIGWLKKELTKKENERMRQLFESKGVPY